MKYHDLFVSSFISVSASVTKLLLILSNKLLRAEVVLYFKIVMKVVLK